MSIMTNETEKAEFSFAMAAIALRALQRLAFEFWHRIGFCDGRALIIEPPITCVICVEEFEACRRQRFFETWDGIGLGYVGP
jgi:hypothetical protein